MKDGREELITQLQQELEMNKAITSDFVDEIQKYSIWFLEWIELKGFEIDTWHGNRKMTAIVLWNEFLNDIYTPAPHGNNSSDNN